MLQSTSSSPPFKFILNERLYRELDGKKTIRLDRRKNSLSSGGSGRKIHIIQLLVRSK
jgi:hypothetical protein